MVIDPVADTIAAMSGVAESRGFHHSERIAGARFCTKWRTTREEALALARSVLVDLSRDARVLDGLAPYAARGAARRWRFERDGGRVVR